MSSVTLASKSGLTSVTVELDEDTGIGEVQVTTYGNVTSTTPLPGEYAGTPDAEPRSEFLARIALEAEAVTEAPEPDPEPGPDAEPEPEADEEPAEEPEAEPEAAPADETAKPRARRRAA